VTRACLECHEEAAEQIMHTAHWTWESEPHHLPGRTEPVTLGKKHALNNFCIGVQANLPRCTSCHIGFGWQDDTFDFGRDELIDCLVCHDGSGTYAKGIGGQPLQEVDLAKVARSVGAPTRENCGGCHFRGGGGNAVKHGDLDESLYFPPARIDVHMGKHDMVCTDCHQTRDHQMKGRAISVSFDNANQVFCADCHTGRVHRDDRINAHTHNVSCQACHIPVAAIRDATKIHWDWSAAGQDLPEDPHLYLKAKGKFEYQKNLMPEYHWYDGTAEHYILGDVIDTNQIVSVTHPNGDVNNPRAKIWPFKVHRGKQIYDTQFKRLIAPKTYGEGGYWTEFDWDKAARLGSEIVGLPYSGAYGFIATEMYWPITHMVASKEKALQCVDCHGNSPRARLDWYDLGYNGDPLHHGGRRVPGAKQP
jgi:octaheme c-type cytochrome (tetrathionate reductase family)